MNRILTSLAILLLASGLSLAQDTTTTPPASSQTTQTDVGQPTDTNEPVFKGCLAGTKDNYTLTAADGTTYRLYSDKDIVEHVGHMVEIRGTVKPEGADRPSDVAKTSQEIDVADLKAIEGSCAAASTGVASTEPAPQATVEQPAVSAAATAAAPAADATATASAGTQPEATPDQPVAAAPAGQQAAVTADQSAAADQNTVAQDAGAPLQDENASLPQTASPLPLLGLIGLGSLGLGFFSRRRK